MRIYFPNKQIETPGQESGSRRAQHGSLLFLRAGSIARASTSQDELDYTTVRAQNQTHESLGVMVIVRGVWGVDSHDAVALMPQATEQGLVGKEWFNKS